MLLFSIKSGFTDADMPNQPRHHGEQTKILAPIGRGALRDCRRQAGGVGRSPGKRGMRYSAQPILVHYFMFLGAAGLKMATNPKSVNFTAFKRGYRIGLSAHRVDGYFKKGMAVFKLIMFGITEIFDFLLRDWRLCPLGIFLLCLLFFFINLSGLLQLTNH